MNSRDDSETLVAHLYALSKEFSRLCDCKVTEQIPFEDYNNILEYETKLNAFGNLLSVSDTMKFLQAEIEEAECYLADFRRRLGISDSDQEEPT